MGLMMSTLAPLAFHLEEQGVEFMQFAFRWMNCLLMREISVKCTIRMWDTYLVSCNSLNEENKADCLSFSPKAPMPSRNFIYTSAQHSSSSGARSFGRWISRCVAAILQPHFVNKVLTVGPGLQEIIMFLQCLPTQSWADHDVELLLSEAFVLKSVWQGAENHFMGLPVVPLGGGMGGRQ